jgi:hypothetical protein
MERKEIEVNEVLLLRHGCCRLCLPQSLWKIPCFSSIVLHTFIHSLVFDLCSTWTDDDKTQMGRRLSAVCYGLTYTQLHVYAQSVHYGARKRGERRRDGKGTDRQNADSSSDPTYYLGMWYYTHPHRTCTRGIGNRHFLPLPSSSLRYKIASTPVQTERIKGVEGVRTTKEGVKGNSFSNLVIGTSETW